MTRSTVTKLTLFAAFGLLAMAAYATPKNHVSSGPHNDPQASAHVDLVIALDISGSMDGLIDSTRQKLWDTVNLLSAAKPRPVLRVGLVTYGNDSYSAASGWVNKDSDLTTDLDSIYAKLFALRTNGGTEYVARAVKEATENMQWSKDAGTLRMVFVAGNEPANQDPKISVQQAMQEARAKGIFVNAVYCGQDSNFEAAGWRQVASIGGGTYAAIDQNRVAVIATPMDAELSRLSGELNKTYLPYGSEGHRKSDNQKAQDNNAASLGAPAEAARATAKAGAFYVNEDWDLVDASRNGNTDVGSMESAQLPSLMRGMSPEERRNYVSAMAKDRAKLAQQIGELSKRRQEFIEAERKKNVAKEPAGLGEALEHAVRTEARSAGFDFSK